MLFVDRFSMVVRFFIVVCCCRCVCAVAVFFVRLIVFLSVFVVWSFLSLFVVVRCLFCCRLCVVVVRFFIIVWRCCRDLPTLYEHRPGGWLSGRRHTVGLDCVWVDWGITQKSEHQTFGNNK